MNACDARIMHGAYERGSNPTAALFAAPSAGRPRGWGLAAVHEGAAAGKVDAGMCGASMPNPGNTVMVGWQSATLEDLAEH